MSVTKLLIILLIVLLLFGAGRLSKVMGELGKGMRAMKDGLKKDDDTSTPKPPADPSQ